MVSLHCILIIGHDSTTSLSLLRTLRSLTLRFLLEYQVEAGIDWGRLGDTDDYFWETHAERKQRTETTDGQTSGQE
ncbi:MAG: hypothetical protein CM15mV3_0100 [Caudoviricetes sp.]|nr:MAG: hypothetical protein CM15mV3_0100 [Caudoviricetes sp.]